MGWSGYRYDQPTRLYAVRFRFYDAVTFRWLNRDPAGYVDSMNLHGYGIASRIGWSDPFGLGDPFFAGGVTLDGEVITYDQIDMIGMGFWQKAANFGVLSAVIEGAVIGFATFATIIHRRVGVLPHHRHCTWCSGAHRWCLRALGHLAALGRTVRE